MRFAAALMVAVAAFVFYRWRAAREPARRGALGDWLRLGRSVTRRWTVGSAGDDIEQALSVATKAVTEHWVRLAGRALVPYVVHLRMPPEVATVVRPHFTEFVDALRSEVDTRAAAIARREGVEWPPVEQLEVVPRIYLGPIAAVALFATSEDPFPLADEPGGPDLQPPRPRVVPELDDRSSRRSSSDGTPTIDPNQLRLSAKLLVDGAVVAHSVVGRTDVEVGRGRGSVIRLPDRAGLSRRQVVLGVVSTAEVDVTDVSTYGTSVLHGTVWERLRPHVPTTLATPVELAFDDQRDVVLRVERESIDGPVTGGPRGLERAAS